MRKLKCRDAGFDCEAVVTGENDDEVLAQAEPHVKQVHGVNVTPEMADEIAAQIQDA